MHLALCPEFNLVATVNPYNKLVDWLLSYPTSRGENGSADIIHSLSKVTQLKSVEDLIVKPGLLESKVHAPSTLSAEFKLLNHRPMRAESLGTEPASAWYMASFGNEGRNQQGRSGSFITRERQARAKLEGDGKGASR